MFFMLPKMNLYEKKIDTGILTTCFSINIQDFHVKILKYIQVILDISKFKGLF